MKTRHALANVSRSAALATMAAVLVISLQAGVEPVFAVLRGMAAFLIVQWVLGAVLEVLQVSVFRSEAHPTAPAEREPPQP